MNKSNSLGILGKSKILQCMAVVASLLLSIYLVNNLTNMFLFGFNFVMFFNYVLLFGGLIALVMFLNYNIGIIFFQCEKKIMLKLKTDGRYKKILTILIDVVLCLILPIIVSIIVMSVLSIAYSNATCIGCEIPNKFSIFLCSFLIMIILNITTFVGLLNGYRKDAVTNINKIEQNDSVNLAVVPNGVEPDKNSDARGGGFSET